MDPKINHTVLSDLTESIGLERASHIIKVFLEELDTQVDSIHSMLENGQLDKIASLAHTIKSTSATFGAVDLNQAALRLETAARGSDLEAVKALIGMLISCVEETKPLYKSYTE